MPVTVPEYGYKTANAPHTYRILMPQIERLMPRPVEGLRMLDIGCGNGFNAGHFLAQGVKVVGIDPSEKGIAFARQAHPTGRFERLEIRDDILEALGEPPFDVALSTEVIEHIYAPRDWARCAFNCLRPGGRLICTTPYHGYLKNVLIALTGKFDWHVKPLWDGGHIKFWSRATLSQLLTEAGFINLRFRGAGRAPYLWMSMVISVDRPG